jgi:glyoxylate reductase
MPRVFITRKIPDAGLKLLAQHQIEYDLFDSDLPIPRDTLFSVLQKPYNALLCTLSEKIDAELLDLCPSLKIVANFAVGYDNINVPEGTKRNVAVSNTPDVLSEATADQAMMLMLAVARRVIEGHLMVQHDWRGWAPTQLLGQDITGKTLGIIGMGRIGQEMAKRAKGFNMTILYHNRSRSPELESTLGASYADLDTLCQNSDVISLHCPSTPETRHLINEIRLRQMKPNAILINTARGNIVHEEALVKALKENWIFGAGLDVYEFEPKVTEDLKTLPNVVLAPHLGSATQGTRDAMITLAVNAILAVLSGNSAGNILNPEVLKINS